MHSRLHAPVSNQLSAHYLMPLGFKARVSSTAFDTSPPQWRSRRAQAICLAGCPAGLAVHHSSELEWAMLSRRVISFSLVLIHPGYRRHFQKNVWSWLAVMWAASRQPYLAEPSLSSGVLLVSHAGFCCLSEPSGPMSLPGRSCICRIPDSLLAIADQAVLSNQAWVPQYCCVCRKRV